ncbi:ABC transporter permease [Spirillospora sp. NPDC049652]|jgi:hypothetical protein
MWLAPERRSARRWAVPVLVLLAGLVVGGVLLADGRRGPALISLAVLAGYAAHLAYRRDEQGLAISEAFGRGHRGRTHLKAAAMTGDVLSAGLVAALVVQALRGADITPYAWLALLAGATYLLSALTGGRAP